MIALSEIDERLREAISSSVPPPARYRLSGKAWWRRIKKPSQPTNAVGGYCRSAHVEPEVGKLANAYLYSVDDLKASFRTTWRSVKPQRLRRKLCRSGNQRIYGVAASTKRQRTIREYRSQAEHVRDELTAKA